MQTIRLYLSDQVLYMYDYFVCCDMFSIVYVKYYSISYCMIIWKSAKRGNLTKIFIHTQFLNVNVNIVFETPLKSTAYCNHGVIISYTFYYVLI